MSTLLHRDARNLVPEMLDWLESPFMTPRPYLAQPIRLEEYADAGRWVVRAEVPGFDPEKDIGVTMGQGFLTIRAERPGGFEDKRRTEVRYGTFTRTVLLPAETDTADAYASCYNGILTISIGLKGAGRAGARTVPVTAGKAAETAG
jgi:HSP20 family protein